MKAPTQLELMAFADGELDDDRAEEVAAWVAGHPEDARIVRAIGDVGAVVANVAGRKVGTDVADDVLAAIDRIEAAERNAIIASTPPPPTSRIRTLRPAPASGPVSARSQRVGRVGAAIMAVALAAAAAAVVIYRGRAERAPLAGPIASIEKSPASNVPATSDDAVHGTDVDAVDFGAHQGAIFYVPGQANTSTVVVWIAEEPPR